MINDVWGKENFKKVIRIDLRNDVEARKLIKNYPNPEKIMEYLSLRFGTEINKDTLLFFDEIQEAIQILTAAKYFSENHKEIPVIMTGSLVRVKLAALEKNNNLTIKLDPEIEKENQDGHNNFLLSIISCLNYGNGRCLTPDPEETEYYVPVWLGLYLFPGSFAFAERVFTDRVL